MSRRASGLMTLTWESEGALVEPSATQTRRETWLPTSGSRVIQCPGPVWLAAVLLSLAQPAIKASTAAIEKEKINFMGPNVSLKDCMARVETLIFQWCSN